jgi:lysyl-tRNA synthetase class 2
MLCHPHREYSVKTTELRMLSKSLRMLPTVKEQTQEDGTVKRYDEFADIELRYRKRYLDLLLNPERRQVFEARARLISSIRRFLDDRGFLEVETPVLQSLYGGANARPFIHPSQHAGHRLLPAHCHRTVSQAAHCGRHRARV